MALELLNLWRHLHPGRSKEEIIKCPRSLEHFFHSFPALRTLASPRYPFSTKEVIFYRLEAFIVSLVSMSYTVKHLNFEKTFERPSIFLSELQKERSWQHRVDPAVEAFHKTLPYYDETKLHSLPSVASELGFSHVFVKDESTRFGLPSFKILGASWAIHQALCTRLELPSSTSLEDLTGVLKGRTDVRLVTCTEGNWGRACARMAKHLGIPCTIYVPWFMNEYTQGLLRGEGADVKVLTDGSYDDTIAAVQNDAETTGAMMVMDTSWEGYTEAPHVNQSAHSPAKSLY